MNGIFWVFVCIAIVGAIVFFLVFRLKQRKVKRVDKVLDALPIKHPGETKYHYKAVDGQTPNIDSVVSVPEQAILRIAEGIKKQIAGTSREFPHWQFYRKVSDYNVLLIDPDRENVEQGEPDLLIAGIYSAGTVIGLPGADFRPMTIVLPHHEKSGWKNLQYLENSARNESEHYAETNDLAVFQKYVSSPMNPNPIDQHPRYLTPEELTGAARGFAALRKPHFNCGLKYSEGAKK